MEVSEVSVSGYVRVSTQRQTQAQTIEQQLDRIQAYAQQQGWMLNDTHIFRDDGYSGATLNRPGLDRLRDVVRCGEVTHILMTAPDRLARSYVHQVLLMEEFKQLGCMVTFLDRPMSQDPHDQLLLQIRGAVAEYERTLIADRMRRGRQLKLKAGTLLPWTHVPFGYRVDPDHPRDPTGVRVDDVECAWVREMFAWYAGQGHSLIGLAWHLQELGVPTPTGKTRWNQATVRGILTNPAYVGEVYANRTRFVPARVRHSPTQPIGRKRGGHQLQPREQWLLVAHIPAIVTHEVFEQVQQKLAQNRQFARRNNHRHAYLLRALVSCGVCNLSCTGRHNHANPNYAYYVCRGKSNSIHACRDHKCTARMIPANQLDELVWQDVCEVLTHPEMLQQALERAHGGHWLPHELQARRDTLRKARATLAAQLERLTDAYLSAIIGLAEYERRRVELQRKLDALDQHDTQLDQHSERHTQTAALTTSMTEFCQRVQSSLASATCEQKRHLIELLIDRVVVTNDQVEIRYVIPTSPAGELTRFCHLRLDYLNNPTTGLATTWLALAFFWALALSGTCNVQFIPIGRSNLPAGGRDHHCKLCPSTSFEACLDRWVRVPSVWQPASVQAKPNRAYWPH